MKTDPLYEGRQTVLASRWSADKPVALALLTLAIFALTLPAWAQDSAQQSNLVLEDCRIRAADGYPGIKALCGEFQRPENPAAPDDGTVSLFVAVVPALSLEPEADPFVPIAGGPGQASSAFYAGTATAFEDVRRNRDIVLLDQRGTGQSAPMTCAVEEEIIEGLFSEEQTISQARDCLESLPHDPRYFTTSVAVQDLEALRIALGYKKFNLYGISYGTRVAQHFLRQYPAATRSVILDGIVPPQLALGPGIAIEAQNTLEAIFIRCAEDAACGNAFPDLREDFAELRARLSDNEEVVVVANPLTGAPEEITFGSDDMAGALRLLSYHPNSVALMPLLIDQAVGGNYGPLASQFLMIAASLSDQISVGMHNAVVCTEDAPYFAGENVSTDELAATYIGPVQLDALAAICSVWPQGTIDDNFKLPVESDVPVLLLSGENDPITPPAYGDLAAIELTNFTHLTGRRQGHGMAPRGCVADIIGDFVTSADPGMLETACIERLHAMPFFVDFSGPSP